jgi:hypothetical protein
LTHDPTLNAHHPLWWERPYFVWLVIAVSAIPMLAPSIPPLVDAPGHMGRYAIQLGLIGDHAKDWYSFHWALIGNLGVDLLVQLLAPLLGLELAVKLIVAAIPALQVAGFLLAAKEVHGRLPPTALFAAPLAYSFPFQFGFINFALSAALAFLALALWVRLGRQGRLRLRAALFVPISLLIWLCHTYGFGLLGVLAFGAEVARLRRQEVPLLILPLRAAAHCLVLTLPFLPMIASRTGGGGFEAGHWFNWFLKWEWINMVLRDRWEEFDKISALILGAPLLLALWWKSVRWSGGFLLSAALCWGLYICLPRVLFGSAYADMRLVPFAIATAILAVGPANRLPRRATIALACLALLFFGVRTAATTVSFWRVDQERERHLATLDQIPHGAKLYTLVGMHCLPVWSKHRLEHLPAMALVRRQAFSNDQWDLLGSQLLRVKLHEGTHWTDDPSQLTTPTRCRKDWNSMADAVAGFPRQSFDYLWIIARLNGVEIDETGLVPIWKQDRDTLYRVDHRISASASPLSTRQKAISPARPDAAPAQRPK